MALNVVEDVCDDIDVMNGLYGEEALAISQGPDRNWAEHYEDLEKAQE